jgi:cation diffusion facilitator CzcD-associated flavoprotein CzcO
LVVLLFVGILPFSGSKDSIDKSKMSFDTEVLIIGAGMSGLGLAVRIIRKFGIRNFELVEKSEDVGGTWLANTYPGCGCDASTHIQDMLIL